MNGANTDRDKIIEIIKLKGPILPVQLSKELNTDTLMASAILSELVSQKKIKFSHTKFGGSPLYYVDGQEAKLQQLYNQLHETEKKSYDLLLKKKVLRDKELEPAFRVALRQIKDFAIPLELNINGVVEIFWKWYLTSNKEVESILQPLLEEELSKIETQKLEEERRKKEELAKKEIEAEHIEKKRKEFEKPIEKSIIEKELKEKIRHELLSELKEEIKKEMLMQNLSEKQKKDLLKEKKKKELEEKDEFLIKIKKYCQIKNVQILNYEILKRNNEIDLLVNLPSAVGNISYYCKAKNKKKINESDLSSAFIKSQSKKMPLLFLTTGDLIKKTQEKLSNEFKGISFKNITNND